MQSTVASMQVHAMDAAAAILLRVFDRPKVCACATPETTSGAQCSHQGSLGTLTK